MAIQTSDLVAITLTTIWNRAATDKWWRETNGVAANLIRQDAAATINVYAYNYTGIDPLLAVHAELPQFTAAIEEAAGEIVYEKTDGTELLRFDFPTYSPDVISPGYTSPDQSATTMAAFIAYDSDLVFRVTLGMQDYPIAPQFSGTMSGTLAVTPAHNEHVENIDLAPQFSGSASGTFTASLDHNEAAEPVAIAPQFSGSMAGEFAAQVNRELAGEAVGIAPQFSGSMAGTLAASLDHNESPEPVAIAPQFAGSMAGAFVAAITHNEHPEGVIIRPAYAGTITGVFDARIIKRILAWPDSLPDIFLREGFNLRPRPAVAAFSPTRGRPMTRPLVTQPLTDYVGTFLMTAEEWQTLLDFYRVDAQQGRGRFDLPDPLAAGTNDLISVKFSEPPRRTRIGAEYAVSVRLTGYPSN